jgi:transposase-like protein
MPIPARFAVSPIVSTDPSVLSDDGLRYIDKPRVAQPSGLIQGSRSCLRCGSFYAISQGVFRRFAGKSTFFCTGCADNMSQPTDEQPRVSL